MRIKYILSALLLVVNFTAFSQTFTEWHDPAINAIKREPINATFFAYENKELAVSNERIQSRNFMSLNGMWNFSWAGNAGQRPTNFFSNVP